jgi:hypothetical protein
MKTVHRLIGRGKVGWHTDSTYTATYTNNQPSRCSSSGGTLESYLKEAEDGCLVYDAIDADYPAFAQFVIAGPMVNPCLPPGRVSRFGEHKALLGMLPGLQGEFATIGVMALCDVCSLDSVSPDVYVQMLREKVPGVKVGKVVNHQVEWE